MADKDPYSVLGVTESADDAEIKSAYRRLTKQYHPDLHPDDPSCAEKMSEINAAYDLIKDADSRRKYAESRVIRPGSGYGYGSGMYGDYGSYGQSGFYGQSGYSGYSSYGSYGQSGYYGSGQSSGAYSDSYGQNGQDDGDGVWVFTPFGAFKVNRGSSSSGSQTRADNADYQPRRRVRRPVGLVRFLLMLMLINAIMRSCNRVLYWEAHRHQPSPGNTTQYERQFDMQGPTESF